MSTLHERINALFDNDTSSAEISSTFDQMGKREVEIHARLAQISSDWAGGQLHNTPEQQTQIKTEAETLNVELQQLADRATPLLDLKDKALRREAPGMAANLLKELPAKLQKAEAIKAQWLAARTDLNEHFGALGHQRDLAKAGQRQTKSITEDLLSRIVSLMDWLPENVNASDIAHRSAITRLAAMRSMHLDETFEVAQDHAWRQVRVSVPLQ